MGKRKLAFYEIDEGKLALQMQKAFERVQMSSINEGVDTAVSLEINIVASKDGKYGGISYKIKEKHPPKKSIKLTTQLDSSGVIIGDGRSIVDVLQEELEFPKIIKLENQNG